MKQTKIIIAGVGGQGVVYLTDLLCQAAVFANIPVATSEIHGLSQRSSSVIAGITFGENTFGMVEKGGADFLLGLELLEAQRCIDYLHENSIAVIDNTKIFPHSVNMQKASYPDTEKLIDFLDKNIREVIFIEEMPDNIDPIMRNIVVLGRASAHRSFPLKPMFIEMSIETLAKDRYAEKTIKIFQKAVNDENNIIHTRINQTK